MPRSPTSSEDEMAQSFSDYSVESESDSSKEETIYDTIRATAEKPSSRMEDSQSNTLVIRIIIPDLQQTVRQSALQLNKVKLIISFPGFNLQYICSLFLLFFKNILQTKLMFYFNVYALYPSGCLWLVASTTGTILSKGVDLVC